MRKRLFAAMAAAVMLGGCAGKGVSVSSGDDAAESSAAVTAEVTVREEVKAVSPARVTMPQHLVPQEISDERAERFFELTGSRYPAYANTDTEFYPTGEEFYAALLEELRGAQDFIFLEYFIVSDGEMLDGLVEVLKERIDAGVDVRLICDGLKQNDAFAAAMQQHGVDCRLYREPDRISVNQRDHRKLAVIDGRTAFMGGVNIADEYINVEHPYGRWKDCAIKMQGDAVRSCTELFFEQWEVGGELADCTAYLDKAVPAAADGYVLPFGESPYDDMDTARDICLEIINTAEDYLYITAPYLNIDDEVEKALCDAANRCSDVVIIVPGIPDKPYMELLAREHYRTLTQAGVRVYRYLPGFIHAKIYLCDDEVAAVGSVNLNNRSFYCDFECAAVLIGTPSLADIKTDILATLDECRLLTVDSIPQLTPEEQLEVALYSGVGSVM